VAEVVPPRGSSSAVLRPAPSASATQPLIQVRAKMQASVLSEELPEIESTMQTLQPAPAKPLPSANSASKSVFTLERAPEAQIAKVTEKPAILPPARGPTRPAPLPPVAERVPTSAALPSSASLPPVAAAAQPKTLPLPEVPRAVVPQQSISVEIVRSPLQEPLPEFRSPLQEPLPFEPRAVPRAQLPPLEVPRPVASVSRVPKVTGGSSAVIAGERAATQTTTQLTKAAVAVIDIAALVDIGVNLLIFIAMETMPYWLPLIYKQSGMVNNTLYEAQAYINFQGGETVSCSRANFHFYPYNRKDLRGRSWQEVGGDRGRMCLPERYVATVFVPQRQLVSIQGTYGNKTKDMKIFSLAFKNNKQFAITWKNA